MSLSGWVAAADLSQEVEDGVVKMEDAFKCLYCEYSGAEIAREAIARGIDGFGHAFRMSVLE